MLHKYKEIKRFEVTKDYSQIHMTNFMENSIVKGLPGFESIEMGLNSSNPDYDLVVISFTWESKEAFMNFKKSDAHLQSHKKRTPNPKILKYSATHFEVTDEWSQ
ncbi:antibiotic biosynthesis monooxygenase [Erysipelothrix sp. HDW6B]|uniref:antibiotic biosynthesis monooxygenase family protein n=1 Tax=Erysipelothrix sp. HDW6B TaxID=2714929 RepID=UPI0014079275|nr:antibiotic biosynthesis monooxygenase [Erysipelothrix sp. HDW6B]QIK86560.1 antibiotic biosynthesis monooxygenase [Erysipelothrix sp. HDW6B]